MSDNCSPREIVRKVINSIKRGHDTTHYTRDVRLLPLLSIPTGRRQIRRDRHVYIVSDMLRKQNDRAINELRKLPKLEYV